jgi:hypothetical protein
MKISLMRFVLFYCKDLQEEMEIYMQKKKTFSAMEIALLAVLTGSLIISFIQARLEEGRRK